MDLVRTREIYVNVCMNSFVIDVQALWSTVGLNENDNPKCKSDVEGALYLHFRDNCRFIPRDTEEALWQERKSEPCKRSPDRILLRLAFGERERLFATAFHWQK